MACVQGMLGSLAFPSSDARTADSAQAPSAAPVSSMDAATIRGLSAGVQALLMASPIAATANITLAIQVEEVVEQVGAACRAS